MHRRFSPAFLLSTAAIGVSLMPAAQANTGADIVVTQPMTMTLRDLDLSDGITPSFSSGGYGGGAMLAYFNKNYLPDHATSIGDAATITAQTPTHISGVTSAPNGYYTFAAGFAPPAASGLSNIGEITITPHTSISFTMGYDMKAFTHDEVPSSNPYAPSATAAVGLSLMAITNVKYVGSFGGDPYDGTVYDYKEVDDGNSITVSSTTAHSQGASGVLKISFDNLTNGVAVIGYENDGFIQGIGTKGLGPVSPVPEPSTPMLLGFGVAALALGRRQLASRRPGEPRS